MESVKRLAFGLVVLALWDFTQKEFLVLSIMCGIRMLFSDE